MVQVCALPDQSWDIANPLTASALLTSSRACTPPRGTYREEEWYGLIASHPAGPYKSVLEHALGVLVVPRGNRVGREAVPARTALSGSGFAEA